ncbi:Hsp70 family protein [Actinopolymorpha alba]|uniref:Hsp70 family protein n=1 Tax=Actinopolymorpha alba TaxID=533267 RepID=UPI000685FBA3|nr:Hsp70 family protein [Actinopolymorpha alba]
MRIRRPTPGPGRAVGIDLGTTYSAVARVNEFGKPAILPNRDGENITPSVVFFAGEQPIIGTMAKRSAVTSPLDVVQFVKRSMGDPTWRFETEAGTAYRPEEISALILKRLKEDAARTLNADVTDAVITVPAYFDDGPRRATIDAGTIAGLNVLRVLNEPTAAALAYGIDGIDGTASETILVYDLGGGTFDVTAMWIHADEFRVLATHGDRNLGGFDFDNALMRLLDERFVAAGGPSLLDVDEWEAGLRERAEVAKHTLTTVDRTRVALSAGGFSTVVPVTRAELEDVTSALLSRTRDIAEQVVEEAGLTWTSVDRILLAGGATRMPMVRRMLATVSGVKPDGSANPDEIVALGAAIQAHLLTTEDDSPSAIRARGTPAMRRPVIHDVTSHGLGKLLYEPGTDRLVNSVIVPRNTEVPAKGSLVSYTRYENQDRLRSRITQGDDKDPATVQTIGSETFPITKYPKGAPFETYLAYDADQTVFVEVKDLTADKLVGTFEIHNVANMQEEEIRNAAERIRLVSPD